MCVSVDGIWDAGQRVRWKMNSLDDNLTVAECDLARKRLHSTPGDPFVFADWERVLFLHYAVCPEALRAHVPVALELELYEGSAIVSLVAVTMRRFRPVLPFSLAWGLRPISCQKFFNVRTYVRHGDEPGALFLWGWLSNPFPFPSFGLPCAAARMNYENDYEAGRLRGEVSAGKHGFIYGGTIAREGEFEPSPRGSLTEFALERYSGFFSRGDRTSIFRAWHPRWLQTGVEVRILEDALVTTKFNWFKKAELVGANFAPGFNQVSLGKMRSLANRRHKGSRRRHGASGFYEMP